MNQGIVRNWMSSPVITVTPDTHLADARRIMNAESIRALPVVEAGRLVGIVTKRGLLRIDFSTLIGVEGRSGTDLKEELIGHIMTRTPITTPQNAPMPKAARSMMENKITALPVLDEKGVLIGILTTSDIFRAILAELPELKQDIPVSDYMIREVVTIDPDTSLLETHRLMGTKRIRSLPVLVDGNLVGIVTRTDVMSADPSSLMNRFNQEISLKILTQPVEKLMAHDLITIRPDQPITDAAQKLLENKIHSLPVVDESGALIGILTESDLFRMFTQKFF
ncbi:predicted signal-transduction protein containing cAMP-binding and CBS domains [Longilinea arvoryzae]|uniref:Predicted signal-transduction protein containing cAMP-binding and CBS domains n=1 Tax=Longilinea arvoryzae TaxID=360412 RepID=A0A0S7B9V2_9CHLR|nr:CBS domain-containing protein [Longilinea arvoryzae]GAP14316.1 predicted signal-transduction protein containing cAMP-binding and CBS domains [Longilinea arvoryzae]